MQGWPVGESCPCPCSHPCPCPCPCPRRDWPLISQDPRLNLQAAPPPRTHTVTQRPTCHLSGNWCSEPPSGCVCFSHPDRGLWLVLPLRQFSRRDRRGPQESQTEDVSSPGHRQGRGGAGPPGTWTRGSVQSCGPPATPQAAAHPISPFPTATESPKVPSSRRTSWCLCASVSPSSSG